MESVHVVALERSLRHRALGLRSMFQPYREPLFEKLRTAGQGTARVQCDQSD